MWYCQETDYNKTNLFGQIKVSVSINNLLITFSHINLIYVPRPRAFYSITTKENLGHRAGNIANFINRVLEIKKKKRKKDSKYEAKVKSTLDITKYKFDSFKINASQLEHARTDSQS